MVAVAVHTGRFRVLAVPHKGAAPALVRVAVFGVLLSRAPEAAQGPGQVARLTRVLPSPGRLSGGVARVAPPLQARTAAPSSRVARPPGRRELRAAGRTGRQAARRRRAPVAGARPRVRAALVAAARLEPGATEPSTGLELGRMPRVLV